MTNPSSRGTGRRAALRLGLALSVAVVMAAGLAPAAHAADVALQYVPMDADMTVSQGEAFPFELMATNNGGTTATIQLESWIGPTGNPGAALAFESGSMKLNPGQTKSIVLMPVSSTWFEQTGDFDVRTKVDGAFTADVLTFTVTGPAVTVPTFQDVTAASGISATIPGLYACVGKQAQGAATADVDRDGDLDIYLPNIGSSTLWINNGSGQFTEMAAAYGVQNAGSNGHGAVFADSDNDGDPDLYVVNDGMNRLYRNNADGTFSDVTAAAGVGGNADEDSTSAAWADYDNDGRLDLYVSNYASVDAGCQPTGQYDRLYHQKGDGTFEDVTHLLEGDPNNPDDGNTKGFGFQAAWFDMDGDNDQDLYLANDYVMNFVPNVDHNRLWRNNGDGTFTEISELSDAGITMNGMGIGVADYDADGDLDVSVSNMMGNVLLRNDGSGSFTNIATQAGINRMMYTAGNMTVFWGHGPNDFNLDGSEDLYAAAGATDMPGMTEHQASAVFANRGNGTFLDLSAPSHGDLFGLTVRSPVLGDFDRDGRVDVFAVPQDGSPVLLRNTTPRGGNHFLYVDTVGRASNRDGCGAKLAFTIGSTTRYRQVLCGGNGLASGSDSTVHLGAGPGTKVNRLVIQWPSGNVQVLRNVTTDRYVRVTEPA